MTTSTFGDRLAPNLQTDVRKIPSLEEFSPNPPSGNQSNCVGDSAHDFFDLVSEICGKFQFTPIITEFAYLSDLNVSASDITIEYGIRSFVASTEDQRVFVESDNAAYFRAFNKMIDRQRDTGRSPEPIAGHPNFWQDWTHDGESTPQAGFIHFPSSKGFYHLGLDAVDIKFSPIPPSVGESDEQLVHSSLTFRNLSNAVLKMMEYHSSVETCFRRFVGYFLQEARDVVEPIPRMIPAYRRLYNSYFLGIPFVRPQSATNVHVADALNSLKLEPARGTIFMLFLESDERAEKEPPLIREGSQSQNVV